MSSYLFLAAIIAVVWLAYWVSQNDSPGFKGGLEGLFGMKEGADGSKRKPFTPKWKQQEQRQVRPRPRWARRRHG
jgi:hypothetical protein